MKILILGSGARESALAWMFSKSKSISGLYTAPGNAGTYEIGMNINIDPMNFEDVIRSCKEKQITYVFVGPEIPLAAGIVDVLKEENITAIGPPKKAAQLESSKTFSKRFMVTHNIPTAEAKEFSDYGEVKSYV